MSMVDMRLRHSSLATFGLVKTGQTTEYETGDDGTHQEGWHHREPRFSVVPATGTDIIRDAATGLMWWSDPQYTDSPFELVKEWAAMWSQIALVGAWNGFSDWRIPNILELLSITDWGTDQGAGNILPYSAYFTTDGTAEYWSSTTNAGNTAIAYTATAVGGTLIAFKADDGPGAAECFVRPVRGGVGGV